MTRNRTPGRQDARIDRTLSARGLRFALVVSRYHDDITGCLRQGAREALIEAGAAEDAIATLWVPGSFEIPFAARHAAESGRFDAIVCLGCLIRGATSHFEYIASAVAHGITAAAADTGIPMTFGVLTTDSADEALARASTGSKNKGWEAARAALELVTLCRGLVPGEPTETVE